jgi:DnaJ-class molecular chaperone
MPCPYEILGLSTSCTFQEVKSRYIKLAKSHHPDKLSSDLSQEQRDEHEDMFKKFTDSYRQIEEQEQRRGGRDGEEPLLSEENWMDLWKSVFTDTMKEMRKRYHIIKIPVSLEEVHKKKKKRVEVFLQEVASPMYFRVNCGLFPKTTVMQAGHIIKVMFDILPHDTYHLDNIIGTYDLYTHCELTWREYLTGTVRELTYLDGSVLHVDIASCMDRTKPIVFQEKGLWGVGDLYVSLDVVAPSHEEWRAVEQDDQQKIIETLDALYSGAGPRKVFKNNVTF